MNTELLTIDDIAAMYQLSRITVRDQVVKKPGFPAPAPGTTWKKPRWLASDVRSFLQRKPAQTPQNTRKPMILKAA